MLSSASALTWTGAQTGKWFCLVHVFDPHAPYQAPEEFARRYPNDPYAAEVAWTDYALGPLFDRLASLSRKTLVVVTSDHGESLGEHGELTHGIFAYEPTLRVPLIVAELGGGTPAATGITIDTAVRHIDIMPTVLEVVAAPATSTLPGTSLLDLMRRGGGDDRPSLFEAMTANLSRGWAPLRGVMSAATNTSTFRSRSSMRSPLTRARSEIVDRLKAPAPRFCRMRFAGSTRRLLPCPVKRRRPFAIGCARSGIPEAAPAAPRDRYVEADDPKRLIELDALLHRAGDLYQQGKFAEAAQAFQQVIARRPDTADAYRYLAFVYWQGGRTSDAIHTLETALQHGITHRDVRVKLGVYLAETGNAERAIRLLEGQAGDDIEALNALGIAYGQARRSDDALRTFRHVLEIDSIEPLQAQHRHQGGELVAVLAEHNIDDVVFVGVEQPPHDLRGPHDRGEHQMGLGPFDKRPGPVPLLGWAGPAPADTARVDPSRPAGRDLLHAQLDPPASGEVVVVGEPLTQA